MCQHASAILSCLCILIETHRPQSRRSDATVCQCEREVREGRRGVCLCQEYECLSASYAQSLAVLVCGERCRVRVLTHCPGRDTAKTAVLVIRHLFTEMK